MSAKFFGSQLPGRLEIDPGLATADSPTSASYAGRSEDEAAADRIEGSIVVCDVAWLDLSHHVLDRFKRDHIVID